MSKIFISYRRDDAKHVVGRIFDHLARQFGEDNLFKDVDSIPLGSDFREIIENSVQSCDVVLAIIGEKWLQLTDNTGKRRIDNPDDFVRIEIEAGLKRGIPVIPVLVSDTEIPHEEQLPESLKQLAFQNGLRVRPDPDFTNDITKLNKALNKIVKKSKNFKVFRNILIALVLISLVGSIYFFAQGSLTNKNQQETKEETEDNKIKFIGAMDGIYYGVDNGEKLTVDDKTKKLSLVVANCAFLGRISQVDDYWSIIAEGQDGMCDMVDDPFINKEVGRITPIKGKLANSGRVLEALVNFKIGSLSRLSGIYKL
ncbi:MAG: toll/interleukin-1 receptor domain-containing protein [Thermodesulfobacteriota bacterium]